MNRLPTNRLPTNRLPTNRLPGRPWPVSGRAPAVAAPTDEPVLVAGMGASFGVSTEEVRALLDLALDQLGIEAAAVAAIAAIATVDTKAREPGLVELAAALGVPLVAHPAATLAGVAVPHPSAVVEAAAATPSVAEAAALLGVPGLAGSIPRRRSSCWSARPPAPARRWRSPGTGWPTCATTATPSSARRPARLRRQCQHRAAAGLVGRGDRGSLRAAGPLPRRPAGHRGGRRPAPPSSRGGAADRGGSRGVHPARTGSSGRPGRDRVPAVHRAGGRAAGGRLAGRAGADRPGRRLGAAPGPDPGHRPTWWWSATRPTRPASCTRSRRCWRCAGRAGWWSSTRRSPTRYPASPRAWPSTTTSPASWWCGR